MADENIYDHAAHFLTVMDQRLPLIKDLIDGVDDSFSGIALGIIFTAEDRNVVDRARKRFVNALVDSDPPIFMGFDLEEQLEVNCLKLGLLDIVAIARDDVPEENIETRIRTLEEITHFARVLVLSKMEVDMIVSFTLSQGSSPDEI